MHERPLRRAVPQHWEGMVNGRNGPLAPSTAHPAEGQPKVGSKQRTQSVPKLGLRVQRH
jgi:hypothetical protein